MRVPICQLFRFIRYSNPPGTPIHQVLKSARYSNPPDTNLSGSPIHSVPSSSGPQIHRVLKHARCSGPPGTESNSPVAPIHQVLRFIRCFNALGVSIHRALRSTPIQSCRVTQIHWILQFTWSQRKEEEKRRLIPIRPENGC